MNPDKSQIALVTGGGRRLGRQIALALASSGYNVVINYNLSREMATKTVDEIQKKGVNAVAIKADISSKKEVDNLFRKAVKRFGKIDLLVNSSAVFIDSPLFKTTEKIWDMTIDVNLKGTFLCSQAAAIEMVKRRRGKIINIASLGGIQAWKEHLPYSVSKAGVIMLTRVLAKSLAPYIQVNSIAPGTIIIDGEENASTGHVSKVVIPLKRYGKPNDITSLIMYLANSADYITGQTFTVDGGRTLSN